MTLYINFFELLKRLRKDEFREKRGMFFRASLCSVLAVMGMRHSGSLICARQS